MIDLYLDTFLLTDFTSCTHSIIPTEVLKTLKRAYAKFKILAEADMKTCDTPCW